MNLKEIKDILKLMEDHELAEIEVERDGSRLKIKKAAWAEPGEPSGPSAGERPARGASSGPPPPPPNEPSAAGREIVSPMVGTFYRAPSPESPPFVEVGQVVEIGQVVCIVEAMKLMNEIKSEVKGRIVEVAVDNAEPVEFGQPLFVLEPV